MIPEGPKLPPQPSLLVINRWVGYNQGGTESHIKDIVRNFAAHGYSVEVMTIGGRALEGIHPNLRVTPIRGRAGYYAYGAFGLLHAVVYLARLWRALRRRLREGAHYDLVSAHFSLEAFLMRFVRCFHKLPYALVLDGDTALEIIEGRRADACSHISKFMAEQSRKAGYDTWLLPKSIDTAHFRSGLEVADLRREIAPAGQKVVLAVCRLDPRKNLSTLLKALALVRDRKLVAVRCVIVGEGVEREPLEREARDLGLTGEILFAGSIPNQDPRLPRYYNAADLFVLPTLYEGFGWVFQEAMACGLPILTTDAGSNMEVVGGVGSLVPPRDPARLADEMEAILLDPSRLAAMRQKGIERAREFEWERLMPRYEAFFTTVAARVLPGFGPRLGALLLGLLQDGWAIARWLFFGGIVFNVGRRRREFREGGQAGNR